MFHTARQRLKAADELDAYYCLEDYYRDLNFRWLTFNNLNCYLEKPDAAECLTLLSLKVEATAIVLDQAVPDPIFLSLWRSGRCVGNIYANNTRTSRSRKQPKSS